MTSRHLPVMADEVARTLAPADGEVYVDGTFGRGGYALAWLEAADCIVYGIDCDPEAVAFGAEMAARYPGRLTVLQGRFAEMESLLAGQGVAAVDGVALDLGVSSPQLETAARGFSFVLDGPLDMRMEGVDAGGGPTAADVVNRESESALADIFYRYGEERRSRAIAKAIVAARKEAPFERTGQLAELIARVVGRGPKRDRGKPIHPATRSFQALRIYVNEELDQLARGLAAAERLLAPAGRLVVVAFHSLEDRAVKNFLRLHAGETPRGSRHQPEVALAAPAPSFRLLFRGARKPGAAEAARNPRARSARMRAALRTDAPAWPAEAAA